MQNEKADGEHVGNRAGRRARKAEKKVVPIVPKKYFIIKLGP